MALIAACLIVKNAEPLLEKTLDSIRPWVDGIFIYDTGSTDGTLDLIERLNRIATVSVPGASEPLPAAPIIVERGEWHDDFRRARTANWAMVPDTFSHVIWLDDDDTIVGAGHLRNLADSMPPDCEGLIFFYDYARDEHGVNVCQLWRERLLRRDAGYEWREAVHEVLTPADGRPANLQTIPPDICHWRHDRPAERYAGDRNLAILLHEKELAEQEGRPLSPRTLAYLGTELMSKERFADAAPYFQAYLQDPSAAWSDERMQVYHKLAACLRFVGQAHAGIEVEFQALRERDDWAETASGLTEGFAAIGEWNRVEHWAQETLRLGIPQSMLILNPHEFTFLPLVRLSEACLNQGRPQDALGWIEKAKQAVPHHPLLLSKEQMVKQIQYEADLVQAVLMIREANCRHDENLKALQIMEAVPYLVSRHPAIVRARAEQRRQVSYALDPSRYDAFYASDDKTSTIPDEALPTLGDVIPRAQALADGLAAQQEALGRAPRVIDLGCNDWAVGAFLAAKGYACDGVELNAASIVKARERAEAAGSVIFEGNLHDAVELTGKTYDAVVMFEVLEHVPDEAAALAVCEALLEPDGVVYLSTPNGGFDRGDQPWWNRIEPKQHLRAIPGLDLAEMLASRGEVVDLQLHHDARVSFAAYRPGPRKGKVVLHGGVSAEIWSPKSIRSGGIGGSETALAHVACRLAKRGYEVVVYAQCEEGVYLGSVWRNVAGFDPSEEADAYIISRLPGVFDEDLAAPVRALWCHDQAYTGVTQQRADRMTHVVVLSPWQRKWAEKIYPAVDPDRFRIIGNGVSLDRTPEDVPGYAERAPAIAYSSAPDRGLAVLLALWPQIRAEVPDAELHVYYGWETFDRVATANPALQVYKSAILQKIAELGGEDGGIIWKGRVGQDELAEGFRNCRVLGYPASFRETSCITAMEARVAGLPIVTSRLAALADTVGEHGILIDIPGDDDAPGMNAQEDAVAAGPYGERFTAEVCRMLNDPEHWAEWSAKSRDGYRSLGWENRIDEWERLVSGSKPATPASRRARARRARATA